MLTRYNKNKTQEIRRIQGRKEGGYERWKKKRGGFEKIEEDIYKFNLIIRNYRYVVYSNPYELLEIHTNKIIIDSLGECIRI